MYAGHCASMTAATLAATAASKAAATGAMAVPALYAPPGLSIGFALVAAALLGVAGLLGAIQKKFYIHEFSHADNN